MSRTTVSLALMLSLTWTNIFSQSVSIMRVGQYHGSEIGSTTGEVWYGLFQTSDGFKLVKTKITVEPVHDAILDQLDSQKTGRKISVDNPEAPLFLVKGIPGLTDRFVQTVFSGSMFIQPNEKPFPYFSFSPNERYTFEARATVQHEEGGPAVMAYTLTLIHSLFPAGRSATHQRQDLLTFKQIDMDNPPSILWAGDLDGDGKLDLLMEQGNHYNVRLPALYLSSMASESDLLEWVAEFRGVGC